MYYHHINLKNKHSVLIDSNFNQQVKTTKLKLSTKLTITGELVSQSNIGDLTESILLSCFSVDFTIPLKPTQPLKQV